MEQREIKFRAWDKEEKRWIDIVGINFDRRFKTSCPFVIDYSGTSFRLDDVEVMQFTGLRDKNGKEIYEGDIVRSRNARRRFFRSSNIRSSTSVSNPLPKWE